MCQRSIGLRPQPRQAQRACYLCCSGAPKAAGDNVRVCGHQRRAHDTLPVVLALVALRGTAREPAEHIHQYVSVRGPSRLVRIAGRRWRPPTAMCAHIRTGLADSSAAGVFRWAVTWCAVRCLSAWCRRDGFKLARTTLRAECSARYLRKRGAAVSAEIHRC